MTVSEVIHRCAACGQSYVQRNGETHNEAMDRHDVDAAQAHAKLRPAYDPDLDDSWGNYEVWDTA